MQYRSMTTRAGAESACASGWWAARSASAEPEEPHPIAIQPAIAPANVPATERFLLIRSAQYADSPMRCKQPIRGQSQRPLLRVSRRSVPVDRFRSGSGRVHAGFGGHTGTSGPWQERCRCARSGLTAGVCFLHRATPANPLTAVSVDLVVGRSLDATQMIPLSQAASLDAAQVI